jgi:hypothetical protein
MHPPVFLLQLKLIAALLLVEILVCAQAQPTLTLVRDIGFFHLDENGKPSTERGGIAGIPFDVQPVLKITGNTRIHSTISVEIANNPSMSSDGACGVLIGRSIAEIEFSDSSWLARYTDLGLDRPGRGYSFRFCFGHCGSNNSISIVSNSFNILYGRLRVFSGVGSSVAGIAFPSQPRILIENSVGATFELSTEYTYGVSAVVATVGQLKGRTTVWPALGLVQFTDLRMDKSSLESSSGQYANFTLVFYSCYGIPEAECSLEIPMRVALNFTVAPGVASGATVVTQPNSSIANRPLGSVCRLTSWSRCKRFASVNPPTVAVIDRFSNPIDGVGLYKVCVGVLRGPGFNVTVNATGTLQLPLSNGVATFSEIFISKASNGIEYILRFTIISLFGVGTTHNSDTRCSGAVFTTVDSVPFGVSASEITSLLVGQLPPTFVAAVRIAPDQALSAHLTDNVGNVATGFWADTGSPQVNVEIAQYNGSGRFGRYVFSCDLVVAGKCAQMKSLASPAIGGVATFESFALKSSGTYTVRFYAESLEVYSPVFTVVNSDAVRFDPKISPLHSPCWGPPTIGGSALICRSGGVLRPFLSGPVFDIFDNVAATGQFKFTVRISSSTTANIFCHERLLLDKAGAFCAVSSEKGVLTFTDLAVSKMATGLRLSIGVYEKDLGNPVYAPLFDAYALTDIAVESDPNTPTQAGCAVWPPPFVSLLGYTTTSNKTTVIPLSNIPVSVYIFACNETEKNLVFTSDATLLSAEMQASLCSLTQRKGIPCSTVFKTRPSLNSRPAYKAWEKSFYLYYCAISSAVCPQSGFWRISQTEGFCQNSNDTLQMQVCSSAASPDLIVSTQKWSFRNPNCLSNQTTLSGLKMCTSYASFTTSVSQCNATGTTTVTTVDGIAVFNNIRLTTKGVITLRFMVRLESNLPFFKDRPFVISEAAVSSITALQDPSPGKIGTQARIPALYSVQVNDTFGQGMTGWQCNLNACFAGGVTLTAFVYEVSAAASMDSPSNQSNGDFPFIPSHINSKVDDNRSGVISFQILTMQPGYFVLRLHATYSSVCSYIPESTGQDHILDSAPFRMTLVDVSEITVESITQVVSNRNTPLNLQLLEISAGRRVDIRAALYDSKGERVTTEDEAFLQFIEKGNLNPRPRILFDSCRVDDPTCTGKKSSHGALFTSGVTQFNFVALISGHINLVIKVPSLGLESKTLSFRVIPGSESRIWVVVNPPAYVVAGEFLNPGPLIAIYDQYDNRKDRVLVTNLTVLSQLSGIILETLYGPTTTEIGGNGIQFNTIRLLRGSQGCSSANSIMPDVQSKRGIQLVFNAIIQSSQDDAATLVANVSQTTIILQANQSQQGLAALPLNEVGSITAMKGFSINLQIVDKYSNFICSKVEVTILTAICKADEKDLALANSSRSQITQASECSLLESYDQNGDSFVILNNLVSNYSGFYRLKFTIAQSVTDSTFSNIFFISSGKARSAFFIQMPLDGVSEEALKFKSRSDDITNRLDVIVLDGASNVLTTACAGQIFIRINVSFNETKLISLEASTSNDGNISFQTLVPTFQGFKESVPCILICNASSTPTDPSLVAESAVFSVSFVSNLRVLGEPANGSIGSEIKDKNNLSISVAIVDYYGDIVYASSRSVRVSDIVDHEEMLLLCSIKEDGNVNNKCTDVRALNGIATFYGISATIASKTHKLLFTASSALTQLHVSSHQFSISEPPGQHLTVVSETVRFSRSVESELPNYILNLVKFNQGKTQAVNVTLAQLSEGVYQALPDNRLLGKTSTYFNNSECVLHLAQ